MTIKQKNIKSNNVVEPDNQKNKVSYTSYGKQETDRKNKIKNKIKNLFHKTCLYGIPGNETLEEIVDISPCPKHLLKWRITFVSGRHIVVTDATLQDVLLFKCVKYKIQGTVVRLIL